jgi:hypothetical protein
MADTNDRHQGSDHDLFDETAPRSIFAATWFRAVLVLIVLGVIGAVAVPYILDAMNAPKPSATAKLPTPVPPSRTATPPPPVAVTPVTPPSAPGMAATPAPPLAATPAPAIPPSTAATVPATPAPPITTEQPSDTKLSDTKPLGDGRLADSSGPDMLKPADGGKPNAATTPGATKDAMGAATPSKTTTTPKAAAKAVKATGRQWYVQVGAFKDAATAKNVAAKLREDNYKVADDSSRAAVATVGKTTIASPGDSGDQYDVIITGQSPAELNTRLAAKGLTAEAAGNAAVVKPSMPLRDAVALSKDLAVDGLKVQVRRTGGSAATAARTSSGDALHRVSVGGFPDKATAMATLKELEGKGYKPFLTRR